MDKELIGKCSDCGDAIYDCDEYYDVNGELVCTDCMYENAIDHVQKFKKSPSGQ